MGSQPNAVLHRTLWLLLALFLLGMFGYFTWSSWQKIMAAKVPVLPIYNQVTSFSMTERSGQMVSDKDLLGKIWVADFFFTTCPGPCPRMTEHFQSLQDGLRKCPRVMLVSISVDPSTDTPAVLQDYAKRFGADAKKWWFLSGTEEGVHKLAVETFTLPLARNPDADASKYGKFLHSTRFVLVDTKGRIRGYYDTFAPEFEQHLLQDIGFLMKEEGM